MMSLATFRVRFPEFRTADGTFVQVVLDEAALEIDSSVFGAKTDTAHGFLAAHRLLNHPYGRSQRLESGASGAGLDDRYMQELELLKRQVVSTIMVI
jgi:hypothetical protein